MQNFKRFLLIKKIFINRGALEKNRENTKRTIIYGSSVIVEKFYWENLKLSAKKRSTSFPFVGKRHSRFAFINMFHSYTFSLEKFSLLKTRKTIKNKNFH